MVILRVGKSLYTGSVDNMNTSHGFFILKSNDMKSLQEVLMTIVNIGEIKTENETLIAYLKEPLKSPELNKILFDKGIILSHLVHRKESLEELFLEITKNLN